MKRATAVVVGGGEEFVLVADKTGEVWQYSLGQPTLPETHLLGHFSMLLDMVGMYACVCDSLLEKRLDYTTNFDCSAS